MMQCSNVTGCQLYYSSRLTRYASEAQFCDTSEMRLIAQDEGRCHNLSVASLRVEKIALRSAWGYVSLGSIADWKGVLATVPFQVHIGVKISSEKQTHIQGSLYQIAACRGRGQEYQLCRVKETYSTDKNYPSVTLAGGFMITNLLNKIIASLFCGTFTL